jgi:hypothetical protein
MAVATDFRQGYSGRGTGFTNPPVTRPSAVLGRLSRYRLSFEYRTASEA